MTKEDELMDKQVEMYSQALSQVVMNVTAKCIETDGVALTQASTVALSKTLGASLAALVRGAAKECAEDLKDMGNEN